MKQRNILNTLHSEFTQIAKQFRDKVCEECNYSIPTFYRKAKDIEQIVDGKWAPALSNAEKDKIREIGANIIAEVHSKIVKITK